MFYRNSPSEQTIVVSFHLDRHTTGGATVGAVADIDDAGGDAWGEDAELVLDEGNDIKVPL